MKKMKKILAVFVVSALLLAAAAAFWVHTQPRYYYHFINGEVWVESDPSPFTGKCIRFDANGKKYRSECYGLIYNGHTPIEVTFTIPRFANPPTWRPSREAVLQNLRPPWVSKYFMSPEEEETYLTNKVVSLTEYLSQKRTETSQRNVGKVTSDSAPRTESGASQR